MDAFDSETSEPAANEGAHDPRWRFGLQSRMDRFDSCSTRETPRALLKGQTMAKQPRTMKQQQKLVDDWNRDNAVGTECTARLDSGLIVRATTTSEAYMLGGHTACIFLSGISGAYSLERVRRFETATA